MVPKVYLMLSEKKIEKAEDIKKLDLCCCVFNKEKNEGRIVYIIPETSNRNKPKTMEYIGRLKNNFIPKVEYQISNNIGDLMWHSIVSNAIRYYEFNLKIKQIRDE